MRLEIAQRPAPLRQIRKSLLYIADITPITHTDNTLPNLLETLLSRYKLFA